MLRIHSLAATLILSCLVPGTVDAADAADSAVDKSDTVSAEACFHQLKKLEGEWVGTFTHGEEAAGETTIRYKLTGAGSALVEHLFEGTGHEMVTVYHLDGSRLLLTHYCAAKNQPRMCAKLGDDSRTIEFKFLDGTNMDPEKDMHMHEATIRFVDDDHLVSEWTSYAVENRPGRQNLI